MGTPFRLPSPGPQAWRDHVAQPELHWRVGRSAKELAYAWEGAGWPAAVRTALDGAGPELSGLELLLGLPEHETPLVGHRAASQTDLLVIARNRAGELVVIGVEGKVDEPFDDRLGKWRRRPPPSFGRERRLIQVCGELGLAAPRPLDEPADEQFESLRWQLLHRTAAAIIEARRFNAAHAVMMVHSFCDHDRADGHAAFCAFALHLGLSEAPARGQVIELPGRAPRLWLGWAHSAPAAPPDPPPAPEDPLASLGA